LALDNGSSVSSVRAPTPRGPLRQMANDSGVALDLSATLLELSPEFFTHVAAISLGCLLCRGFIFQVWPKQHDPLSLVDALTSIVIFPLMVWGASIGTFSLRGSVEARWSGQTPESRFFLLLYCSRTFVHTFMQPFMEMSRLQLVTMTLHHLLSLVCMSGGLITGRCHFWACFDGMCEVSTIFLNNMCLLKWITVGGRRLQDVVPSSVAKTNGMCLWLAFLLFRIVLFPTWLYLFYQDVRDFPERTWATCSIMERYLNPLVTAFLMLLSFKWFFSITRGAVKLMNDADTQKSDKTL